MTTLTVKNESGSKYVFYVDDYTVYVDATTKKGVVHTFKVKNVENSKIDVGVAQLPISQQETEIVDFIAKAKTRKTVEIKSHDHYMQLVNDNVNVGRVFTRNYKEVAYVYSM